MSHPPVRKAVPADAAEISILYHEAYKPVDGGEASEHYPFPQLLEPEWVAQTIADGWVHWVVAERSTHIIGSAAAVRNIGSDEDRVAEVFGVVVREEACGLGVATGLLTALCDGLGEGPQFVLCESRTALVAAWKLARRCGFYPLGFEPFAHQTPVGPEAMLLTGRIHPGALNMRATGALHPPVRPLASAVIGDQASALTSASGWPKYSLRAQRWSDLAPTCWEPSATPPASGNESLAPVKVARNDRAGRLLIERSGGTNRHRSGVIAFRRFEGTAPERYDRQYHVVHVGPHALAAALVVHDTIDQRARILDLRTTFEGLQGVLLAAVVDALIKQASGRRLAVVIDVSADAYSIQDVLSTLEFCPTIYYPAFIARGNARIDAIQYTHLVNADFENSLLCFEQLEDWPEAQSVITAVKTGFLQGSAAIRNIL